MTPDLKSDWPYFNLWSDLTFLLKFKVTDVLKALAEQRHHVWGIWVHHRTVFSSWICYFHLTVLLSCSLPQEDSPHEDASECNPTTLFKSFYLIETNLNGRLGHSTWNEWNESKARFRCSSTGVTDKTAACVSDAETERLQEPPAACVSCFRLRRVDSVSTAHRRRLWFVPLCSTSGYMENGLKHWVASNSQFSTWPSFLNLTCYYARRI